MALPRNVLVNPSLTSYYHCITRCVRRAFLCGWDPLTRRNFDHRKAWVVERLKVLSDVFAIDVCAYSVMSNHLHLLLRLATERAERWSDSEVAARWARLFPGSVRALGRMSPTLRRQRIALWRQRLANLSWFMRCLNEAIARRANREDGCTGRFWEGRFRSQALLDEAAVLTCMAYVDLNPIRAHAAKDLQTSHFTSIQKRLEARAKRKRIRWLSPFADEARAQNALPFSRGEYIQLLEACIPAIADRARPPDPRPLAPESQALLRKFGLRPQRFVEELRTFSRSFFTMVGEVHRIRSEASRRGLLHCRGTGAARRLYLSQRERDSQVAA